MAVERIIGVDFGTSTSVIRVKRYQNGKPLGEKLDTKGVIFGNGMGEMVPTLIQRKDDEESVAYYGYAAQQKRRKHTTSHSFKVDLESSEPDKRALARKLTEEFFAFMGKQYRDQSDGGHLGDAGDKERTIISYPVKWSEETKQFMIAAARKAGFPEVFGMDEAQAAIHAVTIMSEDHLRKNNLLVNGKASNILLIDMGAGTTDLVLCRHTPGATPKTEILTTWPKSGEILFGGREVDHLLQGFFRDFMEPEDLERALKSVGIDQFKSWKEESVSPALAKNDAVTDFFALDNYAYIVGIEMDEYSLDRAGFEKCLGDYLKQLPELINGCIENASIKGSDIDLVIVTGGHSQWYFVKEMLTGKMPQFGKIELAQIQKDPSRVIPITRPQETVALGLVYSPIQVVIAEKAIPVEPVVSVNDITSPNKPAVESDEVKLLAPVKKDGKWGYIDQTGKQVIPCTWDRTLGFTEGLAAVRKDNKWGYIDKNGNVIIPIQWNFARKFSEGYAAVEGDGFCGFIDKKGKLIHQFAAKTVESFRDGLAVIRGNGVYQAGAINTKGEIVLPQNFDNLKQSFSEGLFGADIGGFGNSWGFIDKWGRTIIRGQWSYVDNFNEGVAKVKKERLFSTDRYGYIDKSGKYIADCVWDAAIGFNDGRGAVKKGDTWTLIDKTGRQLLKRSWNDLKSFQEGFAPVKGNGKWGYIDCDGNMVIPCKWNMAASFSNGFAAVSLGAKYGFINKNGELVISCTWDDAYSFAQV